MESLDQKPLDLKSLLGHMPEGFVRQFDAAMAPAFRIGLRIVFIGAFVYTLIWALIAPALQGQSLQLIDATPVAVVAFGLIVILLATRSPNFSELIAATTTFGMALFLGNAILGTFMSSDPARQDMLLSNADIIILMYPLAHAGHRLRVLAMIAATMALAATRIVILDATLAAELLRTGAVGGFSLMTGMLLHSSFLRGFYFLKLFENERDAAREKASNMQRTAQMLAHDLKAPFAMMDVFINALGSSSKLEQVETLVTQFKPELVATSRHAKAIIHDLAEVGSESPVALADHELRPLVEEALKLVFQSKRATDVRIKFQYGHSHLVRADDQRILRVFQNLIGNAVEAMPDGAGELKFATNEQDGHLRVEVTNSGQPLDPLVARRIFEPFYTAGKRKGTGLGLAICRSIVARHGGDIVCEPLPNGASFRLTLPLAQVEIPPQTSHWESHSRDYELITPAAGEQIGIA